ncbi:DNA mismatch endonuclease Vsr [Nocardioides iriomotensis]|uniref:DNA mismatch endonuclease Vsr n=1 Tax=Nocardioides iriomotensis TaxID=715784 RepID=A0A4Q5IXQ3_9ACTN|nr:DNA mismatch endonuclease Vsr [Nocardioides iriomotensis]RYU09675.1 DNA mismatch endonuclease Vsr [Nocardioides iriomotensis]
MRRQKARDTQPELALRRLLHSRGLRYRVDRVLPLPGVRRRADIVFGPARVAVFVDGCFWHGCPLHGNPEVKSNTWYWPQKIERNRDRDADTDRRLRAINWLPIRLWAHDDPAEWADIVTTAVRARSR